MSLPLTVSSDRARRVGLSSRVSRRFLAGARARRSRCSGARLGRQTFRDGHRSGARRSRSGCARRRQSAGAGLSGRIPRHRRGRSKQRWNGGRRAGARVHGRLDVLRGEEKPSAWTGKLWALKQGILRAGAERPSDCFWFTDADIVHSSDNLRRLVDRMERDNLVMVSLMAKLRCESFAERLLIPAFVLFFQMLFPFSWVNGRDTKTAAAAGGCILVRREAFERAGGIELGAPRDHR